MRPSAGALTAALVLGAGPVSAAVNLDGSQAVAPATEGDDPSPIANLNAYNPDQHDCPLPCIDYANIHSWIPYLSVDRLRRCQEPMLLQLSVTQPLDDPDSDILIRTCTLGHLSASALPASLGVKENPKKSSHLFEKSLDIAPACVVEGREI